MATSRMLGYPRLPLHRNQRVAAAAARLLVLLFVPLIAEAAQQPTTTSLTVAPSTASPGQVVTLTATVLSGSSPVTVGTVTFLNGKQVLGTVQVVNSGQFSGTATLKLGFPPGTYQLTAQYNANDLFQGSQSSPQPLAVNGTEPTITKVTATPDGSNYDFTVSVFGYGFVTPTGMASLTEMSSGFNLGNIGLMGPGMSTFLAAQSFGVGNAPRGVAIGDFNGDGFPDLAIGNQSDNTVSVLLGKGDGTFLLQQTYPTGAMPREVASGNFNGDGIADLAVTNENDNTVSVLLGNGDGTFQPQQTYPTGGAPIGLAVADFNRDGIPDLAVTNQTDNTVGVLLGKGDGTFQPQKTYPVGNMPRQVASGDFNGDGIPDLAITDSNDNTVSVLLGKGDGTFQPQKTYPTGGSPNGVVTADFNGDGIPDIAVANAGDNTVSVLLGKGDGTFQPQKIYPVGNVPRRVAVADFNGDGIPDLAVSNNTDNSVGVLLGNGDGTFQPQQTYGVGSGPVAIATADFNGDGVPDVAATNFGGTTVSVLIGGTVTAGQLLNIPVPGPGQQQINATYTPNIDYYSGSQGSVLVQGSSSVATATTLTVSPSVASPGQIVTLTATVLSDNEPVTVGTVTFLNGKQVLGTVQMVSSGSSSGTATLRLGFPPGTYQLTAQYNGNNDFKASTSGPQALTVNGTEPTITTVTATPDGSNWDFTVSVFGYGLAIPDPPTGMASLIEMSNGFNLGNIGLAGPGMNTFLAAQSFGVGNLPRGGVAAGDFNGDGCSDLAVGNQTDNTVSILLGIKNGNGICTGTFQTQVTYPVGMVPEEIAVGDFVSNGILDLAVSCFDSAAIDVLYGNGDGTFPNGMSFPIGSSAAAVAVGDFNGDGLPDLIGTGRLSGIGQVSALTNTGIGTFTQQQIYAVGTQPSAVAVGDFNADGLLDAAVADAGSAQVYVLLGDGTGKFSSIVPYAVGTNPLAIATADFNGDGCLDLAVANFNDSTISVLLGHVATGECDGTFPVQTPYPTGANPQGVAIADFNGDGILDLAVTNAGGNTVGVLLGNGDGTFQTEVTYAVGSNPIQIAVADFLGDGVPDIAVANVLGNSMSVLLGGAVTAGQVKNIFVPGSGQQQVNATYTPNTNYYSGSQGSVLVQGTLIPTTATMAVTANGKPVPPGGGAVSGETIVLNATVMPGTYGNLQAGGTVSFLDLDNTLATIPITIDSAGNGVASFSPTLGLGSHYLSANYSGDNNFGLSFNIFGNLTIVGPYSVSLAVSPLHATPGTLVTMTATVTYSQGSGGTVTFSDGKQALGAIQVEGGSGSSPNTATLKSKFAPGTHSLQAVFNGLGQIPGSMAQSTVQMLTVTGTEPSITTLTEVPSGSDFNFTVTVFGFGFPAPTGLVNFNDLTNGFFIGTVPLAGPGTSTFLPQQTYAVGSFAAFVAAGDFNGDGIPDLAVTNDSDATVSVLLGNGDGTFQPQQTYNAGSTPVGIAVGDFNGDGIPDLVVVNDVGDGTVNVLLGKGDGTFQPRQTYPAGGFPLLIAIGDFNGDGVPDLAVTNSPPDNTVSVLLGQGDGTFQAQQTYPVGNFPEGIATGDLNGDGVLDLIVANALDNTVGVLLGKGDGTFQPQQTYPVGAGPGLVVIADFNGDGVPDLAVSNGFENTVGVLLGNGDGSFQPQQAYGVGPFPFGIVVADFNGDGAPDLAEGNSDDNTISVLLGNGDGSFQPQQIYTVGVNSFGVAAADFNGDGVPDVATANNGDNTVSILLGGTTIAAQLNGVPIIGSGQHMIQSSYVPDASSIYAASVSNTVTVPAGGTAPTNTKLVESPPEGNLGNYMYFMALVQSPGGGTPTGTVSYFDSGSACSTTPPPPPVFIGMWPLTPNGNGQGSAANYPNNTLVAGQHCVTAMYNGDSNYNSSVPSNAVGVKVDGPFMLLPTSTMATVPPGGMAVTTATTTAVYTNFIYSYVYCEAQQGATCSVTCPYQTPTPCTLRSDTDEVTVTISASNGIGRLIQPLRRGEQRLVATVMSLGGMGLVGLVFAPVKVRRKATAGVLLLVIVVLCFGTSCGGSFTSGISSAPVNNTFTVSVKAQLRQQIGNDPTKYQVLGLQYFVFTLVIK